MTIDQLATTIGRGLVAGVAGTAAMTVSSTVEARLRGRPFSTAPGRCGCQGPRDPRVRHRGRAQPLLQSRPRALLGRNGRGAARATAVHLAALWGSEQVMLPALSVAPPITFWGREEIAIDGFHHAVYAVSTGIAYEALRRRAA
jgi:hypothetical protein